MLFCSSSSSCSSSCFAPLFPLALPPVLLLFFLLLLLLFCVFSSSCSSYPVAPPLPLALTPLLLLSFLLLFLLLCTSSSSCSCSSPLLLSCPFDFSSNSHCFHFTSPFPLCFFVSSTPHLSSLCRLCLISFSSLSVLSISFPLCLRYILSYSFLMFRLILLISSFSVSPLNRPSHLKITGGPKMARAALCKRPCSVDFRFCVVHIFLSYNRIGALYGNNLIPWLL